MRANELLLWMSARGRGSWQQFRAAIKELDLADTSEEEPGGVGDDNGDAENTLPLHHELRLNLQRHGHVEFFEGAGGSGWRVTPPSLAGTRYGDGWMGVLAGARTTHLLGRVELAAATSSSLERVAVRASPDQIRIMARTPAGIAAVASDAGLFFQDEAPTALLGSLPVVDDQALRRPVELPIGDGWRVERFSVTQLGWRPAIRDDILASDPGLFRFTLRHRRQVVLCVDKQTHEVPLAVGKFVILKARRRHVVRYDASERHLAFPASCRPPLLVERALILCSGLPPSHQPDGNGAGHLLYQEVGPRVARLACALLRQELR
jgi:hypothetical protein